MYEEFVVQKDERENQEVLTHLCRQDLDISLVTMVWNSQRKEKYLTNGQGSI